MSRLSRIARAIFADLEQSVQILTQKYGPAIQAAQGTLEVADAMETIRSIARRIPEKYLEWTVRQVAERKLRLPEDLPRVEPVMTWYQQAKGDQKFRELVEQEKPGANVKNPLDFSINELEALQMLLTPQSSRRQQLKEQKISGATEVYNDGNTKILRVGGEGRDLNAAAQAACQYAKGTKWCVADPEVGKGYLGEAPLYVIFEDVSTYESEQRPMWEKIALFHPRDNQLMDVEDVAIPLDDGWWEVLSETGAIEDPLDWVLAKATGNTPQEELEQLALKSPQGAFNWADNILSRTPERLGHWPEGEAVIARDAGASLDYALMSGRRFPAGEPAILANKSVWAAIRYSHEVLRGRWPELEKRLLEEGNNGQVILSYMTNTFANPFWDEMGKRWPEVEPIILESPDTAVQYAVRHYRKRWPEAEKVFFNANFVGAWITKYVKMLKRNDPAGLDQLIEEHPEIVGRDIDVGEPM